MNNIKTSPSPSFGLKLTSKAFPKMAGGYPDRRMGGLDPKQNLHPSGWAHTVANFVLKLFK